MTDTVVVHEPSLIVNVGIPGLPGPPGPSGAAVTTMTLVASVALSGHRVVIATPSGAAYADPDNPSHADAVLGVTTGAAMAGAPATIQATGEMTEPSWSWTPGQALYVGAGGQLVSTPPASGWVRVIATAVAPTRILIVDQPPIHQ